MVQAAGPLFLLLLLAVAGNSLASNPAYKFERALRVAAISAVHGEPIGPNQAIATAVLTAIHNLQKPPGFTDFGVNFGVFVWDAAIPPHITWIRHDALDDHFGGAVPSQPCRAVPIGPHTETHLGWPCKSGGSVAVKISPGSSSADLKICFITFQQPGDIARLPSKIKMANKLWAGCLQAQLQQATQPLDLTFLANCVMSGFGKNNSINKELAQEGLPPVNKRLLGVAVIPSYTLHFQDVGQELPAGGSAIHKENMGQPSDGVLQLDVMFVAVLPSSR